MYKNIKQLLVLLIVILATSCTKVCDECNAENLKKYKGAISFPSYMLYEDENGVTKKRWFYSRLQFCKFIQGCE